MHNLLFNILLIVGRIRNTHFVSVDSGIEMVCFHNVTAKQYSTRPWCDVKPAPQKKIIIKKTTKIWPSGHTCTFYYVVRLAIFIWSLIHVIYFLLLAGISLVWRRRRSSNSLCGTICDISYFNMQCCCRCLAGKLFNYFLRQ